MISSISVSDFKSFSVSGYQELGYFNIFCGKNSSGKSSFLQPLLLMSQTSKKDPYSDSLQLNGDYLMLGDFPQITPFEKGHDEFTVSFSVRNEKEFFRATLMFTFAEAEKTHLNSHGESDTILKQVTISGTDKNDRGIGPHTFNIKLDKKFLATFELHIPETLKRSNSSPTVYTDGLHNFLPSNRIEFKPVFQSFMDDVRASFDVKKLSYLCAGRVGPSQVQISSSSSLHDLKADGSNSLSLAFSYFGKKVDPALANLGPTNSLIYEQQVSAWMSYIFDTDVDITGINTLVQEAKFNNNRSFPINVGFGLSYALHIVILCLSPENKNFLVVENPEAHLEPDAQFKLIELLNKVALSGVQIFVETHSDIFVNAVRLKYQEFSEEISAAKKDFYKAFFISKSQNDPDSSIIQPVSLDKNVSWPKGFFDKNVDITKKLHGI